MTFEVKNFSYDGFFAEDLPGIASYTATFKQWTVDPGIALCICSDGVERLIPSCQLVGSYGVLPNQDCLIKQYIGTPSKS